MASPTFNTDKRAVTLAEFGRDVARRAKAAGYPDMPRNAGNRRTDSKRAMLAALEAMGARW
jgi:hypothetical protein